MIPDSSTGQLQQYFAETFFQMNTSTGEWKRIKKLRPTNSVNWKKAKQSIAYLFRLVFSLSSGWFFHHFGVCFFFFFFIIMSFFFVFLWFSFRSYIHTNIYVNIVKREREKKRNQMYYCKEKKLEFVVFFLDEINCNEQQRRRRRWRMASISNPLSE